MLVNNAGIAKIAPLPDLSDDEVSRILDVDLKGAVNMAKCAYSDLADTKGLLLNISSVWECAEPRAKASIPPQKAV